MSILASRPKNCPSFPDFSTPHLRLRGKRTKAHTPTPAQPPDGASHTLNLPSPICLLTTLRRVVHALSSPTRSRIARHLGLARAPDDVSLAGSAPPLCHPRRAGVTSPCFLSRFGSVPGAEMRGRSAPHAGFSHLVGGHSPCSRSWMDQRCVNGPQTQRPPHPAS